MCLGIPGQITAITDPDRRLARVEVGGVGREVNIACVSEAGQPVEELLGQWVLVHVGFAMAKISAVEAERTLALFVEMGELQAPGPAEPT